MGVSLGVSSAGGGGGAGPLLWRAGIGLLLFLVPELLDSDSGPLASDRGFFGFG